MKERTVQVLIALIQDFVDTATPVASNRLLEQSKLNVSSATIRNEFARLEEVGLIKSPHISAGKIPTKDGYRFFVDQLMKEDQNEDILVQNMLEKHLQEYRLAKRKESVYDAVRLLARFSGNLGFANVNNDQTLYMGISNVLRSPEFISHPEEAAQIIEIIEGRKRFLDILEDLEISPDETKIFIGEENLVKEINSCSMLVRKFELDDISGYIGILGPMRMRYGFNKALINNIMKMI